MSKQNFRLAIISFCLGALVFGGGIVTGAELSVVPTTSTVTVDGVPVNVAAYNIDGSNYFKLRDFTAAVDIGVWYDAANNAVHIERDKKYDPSYTGTPGAVPQPTQPAPSPNPMPTPAPTSTPEPAASASAMTAREVCDLFLIRGLPISRYVDYTEENEPNSLMNKPGQYTSKSDFGINGYDDFGGDEIIGGTVEVFLNRADAQARKNYIDELGRHLAFLSEASFIAFDYVLIRFDHELPASMVDEFMAAIE
jgi:hypothetical protein